MAFSAQEGVEFNCNEINHGITTCAGHLKCGTGYHYCVNAKEIEFFNMTRNECANISPKNQFFMTYEATYGTQCRSYPNNDITIDDSQLRVWGCSSSFSSKIENNSCGILNAAVLYNDYDGIFSTLCCKNAPCEPSLAGSTQTELIADKVYVCPLEQECGGDYHICKDQEEIALFGLNNDDIHVNNGKICCRNGNAGCESKAGETELISNAVSACRGTFVDIEDADISVCGPFYHVCNSANELQTLNLSPETCNNVGKDGKFFATLEGITTNTCDSTIDGIWGCGSSTHKCGILNSVITDGDISTADGVLCCTDGEWTDTNWIDIPYMVQLRTPDFLCGGSILTLDGHNGKGAILTAGHCLDSVTAASELTIYIGCITKECKYDSKSVYLVESFEAHDLWDRYGNAINYQHDIGIVYLTEPITHENAISVVVESNPMAAENNGIAKIIGYSGYGGADARGGSDIDNLEYAITNIMTRSECAEYNIYGTSTNLSTTLCLRSDDIAANGMVTLCSGDSGSPIMHAGKQIGAVSRGHDTCDPFYPQIITYIPAFYNWISSKCGAKCMVNDGYLGCYADDVANRALKFETKKGKYDDKNKNKDKKFTVDKCRNKCNGYNYFALQNEGNNCFCENDYELATKHGTSRDCGSSKLGGASSNSLFVHSHFEQKKYLPDDALNNGLHLRYGPGKGRSNDVVYTVESCRTSCSHFKYFSVSKNGECKCDNTYTKSYDKEEYDRHGLFKNVLPDGIEISVNCDNFLNSISFINNEYANYVELPLLSDERYPYDDWTKTQKIMLPNSAHCAKVQILCANAENDDGPAGVMIGIKYKNQYFASNKETIKNGVITLADTSGNKEMYNKLVLSSQTSTTPLSGDKYHAKWIWTCGNEGNWNCGAGIENTFEIDLCKLSVADSPNFVDFFMPKNKNVIYWFISLISVLINIILVYVCCCRPLSKQYTKVKQVQFDESDVENESDENPL